MDAGRFSSRRPLPAGRQGFTLMELVVVLAIIGVMAGVLIPRLPDLGAWKMKSQARKLSRTISALYDKAAMSKLVYRITLDFSENGYYVSLLNSEGEFQKADTILAKEGKFPSGVKLAGVKRPGEDLVKSGKVHIHFFPSGFAEYAAINLLNDNGQEMTLVIHPLTGQVKIYEGRKDLENSESASGSLRMMRLG